MTIQTLILGLIAGYFIWRLYHAISVEKQGNPDKIRIISKETGEVMEMQVIKATPLSAAEKADWDEKSFISFTKGLFQHISKAFASENLKDLKKTLAPDVYKLFEQDILARKTAKSKMDFSLICFDSVRVLHKSAANDEVTVQFVTEQVNLLKNEQGEVIEGDPMNISVMTDTWVLRKISRNGWIVAATQSQIKQNA